eukprot:769811-Amphidinium_carterae.1
MLLTRLVLVSCVIIEVERTRPPCMHFGEVAVPLPGQRLVGGTCELAEPKASRKKNRVAAGCWQKSVLHWIESKTLTMRCGTLLRLTWKRGASDNTSAVFSRLELVQRVKFQVLPKGDWEVPGQPTLLAELTRRCQTKSCMHHSLMTSSGLQKPLLERMLREVPLTELLLSSMTMTSLGSCWKPLSAPKLL